MRKTKIICTLGPAIDSDEMLIKMIENGLDCARLNFSKRHTPKLSRSVQETKQTYSHL